MLNFQRHQDGDVEPSEHPSDVEPSEDSKSDDPMDEEGEPRVKVSMVLSVVLFWVSKVPLF